MKVLYLCQLLAVEHLRIIGGTDLGAGTGTWDSAVSKATGSVSMLSWEGSPQNFGELLEVQGRDLSDLWGAMFAPGCGSLSVVEEIMASVSLAFLRKSGRCCNGIRLLSIFRRRSISLPAARRTSSGVLQYLFSREKKRPGSFH